MPACDALSEVGELVRIRPMEALDAFRKSWKFHHTLSDKQLALADRLATVASIEYYHGGDVLYTLNDIPGIWHERMLEGDNKHRT